MSTRNQVESTSPPLRLLVLEDNPRDVKLTTALLKREGFEFQFEVTDSAEDFQEKLRDGEFDVIIADFNLRGWTALHALELVNRSGKDVPVIVMTGSVGDEAAVDLIKSGASDYVLKDRPARLPVAIRQALEEKKLRQERERAEASVRESEARFRFLFASNPLPMWVYDLETLQFIEVNDAAVGHYGYSREEFLRLRITDIRPPEEAHRLRKNLTQERQALEESGPWRHQLKNGRIILAQITSHLLTWNGRKSALVVAQDITERARAELALRESEERYRTLFEHNLAGVFRTSADGDILECNVAMANMLGAGSPREILAHNVLDFYFSDEDRAKFIGELEAQGKVTDYELRLRRKDGSPLWVIANVNIRVPAAGGSPIIEGALVNITDRKRAKEALKHSEVEARARADELTALMDAVPTMTLIAHDAECRSMTSNAVGLRMLRLPPGANVSASAPDAERQATSRPMKDGRELRPEELPVQLAALTGREVRNFELTFEFEDGTKLDSLCDAVPLFDAAGKVRGAVGSFMDITQRTQAEESLRRSEAYLAAGEKLSHTGSWAWNRATGELFWSQETYRIFGFDPATDKASVPDTFLSRIHPEDGPRIEGGLAPPRSS